MKGGITVVHPTLNNCEINWANQGNINALQCISYPYQWHYLQVSRLTSTYHFLNKLHNVINVGR